MCGGLCVCRVGTEGPAETTLVNNGAFIPPQRLTGDSVPEQPHTSTQNQTGSAHTRAQMNLVTLWGYPAGVGFHVD